MAENFWQSISGGPNPQAPGTPAAAPGVPPPPSEVKVRTMKSDLEEMAKSGGGLPQFHTVKAPRITETEREGSTVKKTGWGWILATATVIAALTGTALYFYPEFYKKSGQQNVLKNSSRSTATGGNSAQPQTSAEFVHNSLFKKPADELLVFVSKQKAERAAELLTFNQKLTTVLAGAKPSSKFLEISFQDETGRDLNIGEILSLSDGLVLPQEFFLEKFNPDPTVFVYKTSGGFWPGYIFELKPEENWLFLKNDVAQLESSSKIENLFLSSPGARIQGFQDSTIAEQAMRTLSFSSGAKFLYIWIKGKLILSTSEEGLKEAMARF